MAKTELTMAVQLRWWVRPMMMAAGVFVFVMHRLMDEDDLESLIERLSGFVVAHGLDMRFEGDA